MRSSQAIAAVQKAQSQLKKAESDLRDARARRQILCSCGKKHVINKLDLLVTHWYVEPYSCNGGGYWNEGEWQFLCPVTGMRNRFMFNDYGVEYGKRDTVGVAAEPSFKSIYRGLFASSKDVYDKDLNSDFYNNYYVDKHRKQFELP